MGPFRPGDLEKYRRRFVLEAQRNLFEAYLRPRSLLINLISYSANSSAAFPRGEAFRFIFSPNGQTLLALSSSRIFVLDVSTDSVTVKRELKTSRRPLSAAVLDDGSILAVLSSKHQANVYSLTEHGVKHLQVLVLDNPPRTIALSPMGTVLAAGYESGVEVFSLATNALTTDRRAVRCEPVDSLAFSSDGAMLYGSSQNMSDPSAVIITAPFYTENDPDMTDKEIQSRMWTTQILFPDNSSTCSHATILPCHNEGDINWVFAFDQSLGTYRAVRSDDTRTGAAYFRSPAPERRFSMELPTTLPTASGQGDMVVAGFSASGLWVYGVPEQVDAAPDMTPVFDRTQPSTAGEDSTTPRLLEPLEVYSPNRSGDVESLEDDDLFGKVDWQESLFITGRQISNIAGLQAAKWVEPPSRTGTFGGVKRLAIVAPGGVEAFEERLGEDVMPVDGGRIQFLDFSYSPKDGESREITVEIGDKKPEMLPEQHGNLDVEVALARRRTVRQNRDLLNGAARSPLVRSTTAFTSANLRMTSYLENNRARGNLTSPSSPDIGVNMNQIGAFLGPYSQTSPRTRDNLHRAATASATSRHPQLPRQSTHNGVAAGHVVYRRPNTTRRQIPHESDADNWVPPPPPYTRTTTAADTPLPEHLRLALLPRTSTEPQRRVTDTVSPPSRASTNLETMSSPSTQHRNRSAYASPISPRRRDTSESNVSPMTENDLSPQRSKKILKGSENSRSSLALRRRPVSAFSPGRSDSIPPSSTLPPLKNINLSAPSPSPGQLSPLGRLTETSSRTSSDRQITLTGPSLRNRLNYPVPPTPQSNTGRNTPSPVPSAPQADEKTYIPLSLRIGDPNSAAPALLPSNANTEPFTHSASPIQISANTNHQNQELSPESDVPMPSPLRIPTSPSHSRQVSHDIVASPSSPPKPVNPSQPRLDLTYNPMRHNSALQQPQAHPNSRTSSRASMRSISTPNLHHSSHTHTHHHNPIPPPPPPTSSQQTKRRNSHRASSAFNPLNASAIRDSITDREPHSTNKATPRGQKRQVFGHVSRVESMIGHWDGRRVLSPSPAPGQDKDRDRAVGRRNSRMWNVGLKERDREYDYERGQQHERGRGREKERPPRKKERGTKCVVM